MPTLPQRYSLVSQTVTILKQEIERGAWRDWLPGERELCESLQVSRNTLRSALVQLKREGLIRSMHGSGNQIQASFTPRRAQLKSRDVAFLTPEPLEHLR